MKHLQIYRLPYSLTYMHIDEEDEVAFRPSQGGTVLRDNSQGGMAFI